MPKSSQRKFSSRLSGAGQPQRRGSKASSGARGQRPKLRSRQEPAGEVALQPPRRPGEQTGSQGRSASPEGYEDPHRTGADPDAEGDQEQEIIYGRQAVLAALRAQSTLNRVWVLPHLRYSFPFLPLLEAAKARGTVIDEVSPQRLNFLTHGAHHQGIAAQITPYQYTDLETLVAQSWQASPNPVLVVLDGIQDPHNLGAIARSVEAFGMQGMVIPQRRAAAVTATVLKVAAGALSTLPVARVVNLNRALEYLKEQGFWVYGTAPHGTAPVYSADFQRPIALVIGSEGEGISLLTQRHCDQLLSIPLAGQTESLNASVAAGIALYEIHRQRAPQHLKRTEADTFLNKGSRI